PEYRGVYRVGHAAPSVEARYTAAVKACGPRAVLSGMAAAYLLGLVKRPPAVPEVTAPTERRVPGIRARRCRRLDRRDTMRFKGIPVTTPARTLVDVAAELGAGELARACHEAHVRFGTTPADVEAVLARRPTAPGAGKLRRILRGDDPVLLSALERAFLRLLRVHDLPLPETNRPVGAHYVDCRWPAHRLTVELDGYRYHHTRHAWEQDRERERAARARGDEFRRYTWADVHEHAEATAAEIARLTGRG
ncbi:MAG TPA: hypothetical protein VIM86_00410, partial [Thermodesulfobacteriota bacterium]